MKVPELLSTAGSLEEVERVLKAGADAITIGNDMYSLRLPGSFDLIEIRNAKSLASSYQARIYVSINALLHQDHLDGLDDYINRLNLLNVDAIVFGDPAVYVTAKKIAPHIALHWNTETTTTNYQMINFWAKKGVERAVLARELSLDAVLETKRKSQIAIQAQIHGMTCIFHSKRELVKNYLNYKNTVKLDKRTNQHYETGISSAKPLFITEQNKAGNYPIFEDYHGTHVMSTEDICMIEHLKTFIEGHVDSLKINGILKTIDYQEAIISIYRKAIDTLTNNPSAGIDPGWLKELESLQPKNRPLGTGFYFKEQIY